MQVPLEISYKDTRKTPDLEKLVRGKVEKLERFCDHITSCRVALEQPHKHATTGSPFRVRIELTVPPGHHLVVTKEPQDNRLNDDLSTVIIGAFQAAERQLKELVDRQQGEVKRHHEPHAFVVRLFQEEGYGFLKTLEGREIYFHQNSVVGNDFERLAVGTQVRFEETMGEMGPQATTVQIVDKPGARPREAGEAETAEPPAG